MRRIFDEYLVKGLGFYAKPARPLGHTSFEGSSTAASATGGWRGLGTTASRTTDASIRRSTRPPTAGTPKAVYVREDAVLRVIEPWLAVMFDADHIEDTTAALVAAIEEAADDEHAADAAKEARETIARCDARLKSYKQALDEGGEAGVIGKWIAETSAERALAQQVLAAAVGRPGQSTVSPADEAAALVGELRAAAVALGDADAAEQPPAGAAWHPHAVRSRRQVRAGYGRGSM